MADIFAFFFMTLMLALLGAMVYKYRSIVRRWLKDPKAGSTWRPSRETILKRHIEDANAELTEINERKVQEGGDA